MRTVSIWPGYRFKQDVSLFAILDTANHEYEYVGISDGVKSTLPPLLQPYVMNNPNRHFAWPLLIKKTSP